MAGISKAFRPKSNGVQKIVSLFITDISDLNHAASKATTILSEVRKRTGWPIMMETAVVPPVNHTKEWKKPNCPIKHINRDSIHVIVSCRLLFRTLSHTKREEQYTISDMQWNTRMKRMLSTYSHQFGTLRGYKFNDVMQRWNGVHA